MKVKLDQGADAVSVVEGNMDRRVSASACSTLRGLRPWHVDRGSLNPLDLSFVADKWWTLVKGDYFIELDERVARANKEGSHAILVSIHYNATSSKKPDQVKLTK